MKIKRELQIVFFASMCLLWVSGSGIAQETTSDFVIEKSIKFHDPLSRWNKTTLSVHIQEPRIQNPLRFSKLKLNLSNGEFSLIREYELGEVDRIISATREARILVNGTSNFSEEVREEYRLDSSRNMGYKTFYQMLYGFPMSLSGDLVEEISQFSKETVFGKEYFMIEYTLKEPIISDRWKVYFSKEDYSVQALKFVHREPEKEDEIILFGGEFIWDKITIPRYRHWYLSESREYLGSDIIVKELD